MPKLLALLAFAVLAAATPASAAGPPLGVPEAQLAAALRCSGDLAGAARAPVLLVHGTGSNVDESWRSGYLHALPAAGIPACAVQLPARSMEDIQLASEYVVHAIRRMAAASGRPIAVVGHSQGGLEPLWALRFWPDLRTLVDDFVALAAPFQGTQAAAERCAGRPCQAAVWQMRPASRFLGALNVAAPPAGPSYTSLASQYDEVVTPAPAASRLGGARNVVLQDVCPNRPVDHVGFLYDNLSYQLVLDAIANPGPADPARLPAGVCQTAMLPFNPVTFGPDSTQGAANTLGAFFIHPEAPAEPILFCYADPASPRGVGTYCPRTAAVAPRRAARPALRLLASPRAVRAGTRVRIRFRVTARVPTASGRVRTATVRGARVGLAGRSARTDRAGRASLVVRLTRPGAHTARATRPGYRPASARLTAAPRRRAPRFAGLRAYH